MVNKENQPHGFGRAIRANNSWFYDGQFKDDKKHGYIRCIEYSGACDQYEC
jgi:hypothetical protein